MPLACKCLLCSKSLPFDLLILFPHFLLIRYGQAVGTDIAPLRPTIPQEGMNNRSLTIATGKLLGGGSAVNGLVWVRSMFICSLWIPCF